MKDQVDLRKVISGVYGITDSGFKDSLSGVHGITVHDLSFINNLQQPAASEPLQALCPPSLLESFVLDPIRL